MRWSKTLMILAAAVAALLLPTTATAKLLPYELHASARRVDPGVPVRIRVVLDPANVIAVERIPGFVRVFRGDHRNARNQPRPGPHVAIPMREVGENEYRGVFSTSRPGIYLVAGWVSTVVDGAALPRPIRLHVTERGSRAASHQRWEVPTLMIGTLAAIVGGLILVRTRRVARPK